MSAINLSGNASGSGTFTIASPNSNTSYTLSLPEEAGTITTSNSPYSTFRNRIINGDMRIDQRNVGAAVTIAGAFPIDRFVISAFNDGAFSAQQDSSVPTGFVNSLKFTTTTADASLGSAQYATFQQRIEGTNISDLAWGTASAKTITLSFWVRSSLTGTFGGTLANSAFDRSYPFTYSISVANTWEYKTVTIAGDTSGTWLTTTGIGIRVTFGLGVGTDFSGTSGAWAGAGYLSATGAVSVIGTLNATWYITGVQLEVGSVATPFERRPYTTELQLCQRYYYRTNGGVNQNTYGSGLAYSTTLAILNFNFPVTMRIAPTALEQSGTAGHYNVLDAGTGRTCTSVPTFNSASTDTATSGFTAASLTAGRGSMGGSISASSYLAWSAEL